MFIVINKQFIKKNQKKRRKLLKVHVKMSGL